MTEIYISIDVETSGPIPNKYSLLSIGACVVGRREQSFYTEIQPINDAFVPEAMKIVGKSLSDFAESGREPVAAMQAFKEWVEMIGEGGKPVFVGFNATFDWSFVNYYFHTYLGDNPFGFGGVDIKSYYMGLSGCSWDDARSSRIPAKFQSKSSHTHNALDDAVEQGEMFERMLRQSRKLLE